MKDDFDEEEYWIAISDVMSGLMLVFLFISISYMVKINSEKDQIEQIAKTYQTMQVGIYNDLFNEFEKDLSVWNATINQEDLSVVFKEPEVLFLVNDYHLQYFFKNILNDFFPRYINILYSDKYRDDIDEIRIEGHTSSEWASADSYDEAYINNMNLSQKRTCSVLEYIIKLNIVQEDSERKRWLIGHLTANGLSSSKLIRNKNGDENKAASRRVEFRIRTNAEKRIKLILGGS
ncbi:MAG: OmpA family protein [Candidatus Electrothrix scaldis]|nr:MAG: OmpA family protein [Candidatus Electrothrix sp. GW3-3]